MDDYFTSQLSTLFGGWELEQIATAADFLDALILAYARLEGGNPPPLPREGYDYYGDYYHAVYFYNLPAFYGRLVAAQRADGGFLDKLTAPRGLENSRLTRGEVEPWRRGAARRPGEGVVEVETEFFDGG